VKKVAVRSARRPRGRSRQQKAAVRAAPVTAAELRVLRNAIARRMGTSPVITVGKQRTKAKKNAARMRWNPDPEEVQKSVAQLVLTIVEFLRRLMERQAIRRMEQRTLTKKEVEAVGAALMTLERTIRDIGKRFGLKPEDLNLDLGPIGKLM
jgi:hypothetical protein